MLFNDYECQRCNAYSRILRESLKQDFSPEEVKLIYRDLPLDQHRWSKRAATVANCIGEQGRYWDAFEQLTKLPELNDSSLSSVPVLVGGLNEEALRACVSSERYDNEIEADATDARRLGAKGAPGTFVAIRESSGGYLGDFIRGAQPYELIREEVLVALEKSGTWSADSK
jgi:protein-disulfide isomerase